MGKHVCEMADQCIYGARAGNYCNYAWIEKKIRTLGGKHKIINGKCDLFKRGKHMNRMGLKL